MMCDILINIISDVLFVFLGLLVFWLLNIVAKRKKLLKFFGIEKSKRIIIYISRLNVQRGGATGPDGLPFSYQGLAIAYEESKSANYLQSLFSYFLPSKIDKPGILDKLLITDIDVKVNASPSDEYGIEQNSSIISIGLPPYNKVSNFIESHWDPSAKLGYVQPKPAPGVQNNENICFESDTVDTFEYTGGTVVPITSPSSVPRTKDNSVTFSSLPTNHNIAKKPSQPVILIRNTPPFSDTSIGFVQRVFDNENKRNIFYIAGLSENSTAGSVYYLQENWQKLFQKYGNETPFLVLLKIDNNNNRNHEIIMEK